MYDFWPYIVKPWHVDTGLRDHLSYYKGTLCFSQKSFWGIVETHKRGHFSEDTTLHSTLILLFKIILTSWLNNERFLFHLRFSPDLNAYQFYIKLYWHDAFWYPGFTQFCELVVHMGLIFCQRMFLGRFRSENRKHMRETETLGNLRCGEI